VTATMSKRGSRPDLIGVREARQLREIYRNFEPTERGYPDWHGAVPALRPGAKVMLGFRIPEGVTWLWCTVRAVIGGRVRAQIDSAPPDCGLIEGETFEIHPAVHVHLTLIDKAAEQALAAWHRERMQADKSAAAAASTEKST
jgi:hypothetical protein